MPGHWTFTNTNSVPFDRCQFCGKRLKGRQRYRLWVNRVRSPFGVWHSGAFVGYVHQVCPDEPPMEGLEGSC